MKYYDKRSPGVGDQFLARYSETLGQILSHPHLPLRVNKKVQLITMKQFPYYVLFHHDNEDIVILQVLHHRRSEKRWNIKP